MHPLSPFEPSSFSHDRPLSYLWTVHFNLLGPFTLDSTRFFAFFHLISTNIRKLSYVPIDDKFYGLDETEIELRQTTRQFFETELSPHAYQIDKDDHYPDFRIGFLITYNGNLFENRFKKSMENPKNSSFMKKCGEMGFHGITVPERFGGLDLGYMKYIIAAEECARYGSMDCPLTVCP